MSNGDRVALVTGANRGLGFEVCRQLAARGLRVWLTARDRARGERAAARLAAAGHDVRFAVLDVADARSIDRCAGRLEAAGQHVSILVNNAGIYPPGRILAAPDEAFRGRRYDRVARHTAQERTERRLLPRTTSNRVVSPESRSSSRISSPSRSASRRSEER